MTLNVHNLLDCMEHLDCVAEWQYAMLDHKQSGWSVDQTKAKIQHRCQRGHLPMTFVAVQDGVAVGTGSLWTQDCPQRLDLSPWLACLYVPEEHRLKGVAKALIDHRLQVLQKLGYREAFIWSDREVIPVHEKFGWRLFDETLPVGVVMRQQL